MVSARLRFSLVNFAISAALFLLLVFIAVYVRDTIIRPFLGDTLAVIWLYFSFKTVLNGNPFKLALATLLIAYTLEFCQYIHIADILGLAQNKIASIVLGSTFDPHDLFAYSIGWLTIVLFEWWLARRKTS